MKIKTCYACHKNEEQAHLWPLWHESETQMCDQCFNELVDFFDLAQMMISEAYMRAAEAIVRRGY